MRNIYLTLICCFAAISAFSQLSFHVDVTQSTGGACDGGAVVVIDSGAGPFSFSWSPAGTATTQNASGLCPGTYTVSVVDMSGDMDAETFTINSDLSFHVTTNPAVNGACSGNAQVIIESGIPPYTYDWTGTTGLPMGDVAAGICPGAHSITVTDSSGTEVTLPFTIDDTTIIIDTLSFHVNTTTSSSSCDGTAEVVIDSGDGPFTYLWENWATGETFDSLCPGNTYTVTVTDNWGNEVTQEFQIGFTYDSNPVVVHCTVPQHDLNDDCSGAVVVNITGGQAPYTASFDGFTTGLLTGFSNGAMCAGIYQVEATDQSGQTAIAEFVILGSGDIYEDTNNTNDPPSDTLDGGLNENCDIDYSTIDLVELDAIVNSDTTVIIHWTIYQTDGSTTEVYDTLNYTGSGAVYLVTASYYCPEKSVGQFAGFQGTIYIPSYAELGVGEQSVTGLTIYPNPFEDAFTISLDKTGAYDVMLTDASGRILLKDNVTGKLEIEAASLRSGIYFVTVSNGIESSVQKIVKK